ncbi:hypothetical protein [Pseudomonas thivervalensis]|uniref:hypothetical protein n=1 Tax=Pseudomonas thivervalensis TaxID=86265 RepID=UPI00087C4659|nr:hypothetical protein [Pseudomonas thivervalensis]SDF40966.1 hypothetical protein SAMN04490204_0620 [Pseudomonas thivervalensis]
MISVPCGERAVQACSDRRRRDLTFERRRGLVTLRHVILIPELVPESRLRIEPCLECEQPLRVGIGTCELLSGHWSLEDIVSAYCVSKAECIKHLLVLERMGLADLKPGNRIRLLVARDFDWLPDGPIRGFFLRQGLPDFMASRFDVPDETLHFGHGMLTQPAYAQLQVDIHKLRSKLAALHNESLSAPLSEKRGTALLLAMRVWEPQAFRRLKRG